MKKPHPFPWNPILNINVNSSSFQHLELKSDSSNKEVEKLLVEDIRFLQMELIKYHYEADKKINNEWENFDIFKAHQDPHSASDFIIPVYDKNSIEFLI